VALNERPDRDGGITPGDGAPGLPNACPDDERLAEYADGLLDAEAREAIEAHLETCANCRSVVVETMAFLGAEDAAAAGGAASAAAPAPARGPAAVTTSVTPAAPAQAPGVDVPSTGAQPRVVPFRSRRWVTGVGTALAAAAALVLIVRIAAPGWLTWLPGVGGRPPLDRLVVALATQSTRPVEGRLMGGFTYARPPSPTRGGTDMFGRALSPDVRQANAEIQKFAEENPSANARAALGVALLVNGDLDDAITTLEQAAKDQPDDPAVLTNVSAAYLARARWFNHPEDWPKALAASERAISLDPNAPEPYFNRALALEGLERRELAAQAWADYAVRDRNSAWTGEAEERRKALSAQQP
jgi:tetratricopeptide (TPR) repeat protein